MLWWEYQGDGGAVIGVFGDFAEERDFDSVLYEERSTSMPN